MVPIIGVNTLARAALLRHHAAGGAADDLPRRSTRAAAIDGAGVNQRFRYITLPVIKPVLIIVTMFFP